MSSAARATIDPSSRVLQSEAIIFNNLDDDTTVMMDVEFGCYFELSPVGARIWALIESSVQVARINEVLVAEYEVDPDTCAAEVAAFLEELNRLEVISILSANNTTELEKQPTHDGSANPSTQETVATAAQHMGMAGARLAWTPPSFRRLAIGRSTQSGYVLSDFHPESSVYEPTS